MQKVTMAITIPTIWNSTPTRARYRHNNIGPVSPLLVLPTRSRLVDGPSSQIQAVKMAQLTFQVCPFLQCLQQQAL